MLMKPKVTEIWQRMIPYSYRPGCRQAGALHLSIIEHKPTAKPGPKTSSKINPEPNALFTVQLFVTKCFSESAINILLI